MMPLTGGSDAVDQKVLDIDPESSIFRFQ